MWAIGVEGTYPQHSAPAGETGLGQAAKGPWANHLTSLSTTLPFVKQR